MFLFPFIQEPSSEPSPIVLQSTQNHRKLDLLLFSCLWIPVALFVLFRSWLQRNDEVCNLEWGQIGLLRQCPSVFPSCLLPSCLKLSAFWGYWVLTVQGNHQDIYQRQYSRIQPQQVGEYTTVPLSLFTVPNLWRIFGTEDLFKRWWQCKQKQ